MTVVFSWIIIQCSFQGTSCLVKCLITYGMHLYLKACSVRRFAKLCYLLIGIIQNSIAAFRIHIRLKHCSIVRTKASVKGALKAPANPGQFSALCHFDIHWLRKHTQLESVLQGLCKDLLKGDIKIHCKTDTAYSVYHTNTMLSHEVSSIHHVAEQFCQRKRTGNIIGKPKKCFLIHLASVWMISSQVFHLIFHLIQQLGVDNTGMTVMLDYHNLLIRANCV